MSTRHELYTREKYILLVTFLRAPGERGGHDEFPRSSAAPEVKYYCVPQVRPYLVLVLVSRRRRVSSFYYTFF